MKNQDQMEITRKRIQSTKPDRLYCINTLDSLTAFEQEEDQKPEHDRKRMRITSWVSHHLGHFFINLCRQTFAGNRIVFNFKLAYSPIVIEKILQEFCSRPDSGDHEHMRAVLEHHLNLLDEPKKSSEEED